ncbi:hypothetical protein Goshw_000764 [Gossypium schwendimanii]|uniref:Kinesin motor domain-containing protein n=1 Tax=Gossypium schwendimanii TaxID=34291 RepID=A0A7J9MRE8_GOSSC|nr:hypothetical protein [Gossypium schwendimanii]
MATETNLQVSVKSIFEDVLQQQGARSCNIYLDSRKSDESSLRRYEAAGWLRRTVGVVGGKDLPAEPSEEEFMHGLRSGIILCNVLNKVQPGSVPKVVEGACDSVILSDGAAFSAYQYFENVRNFRVAIQEMGLPTFETSDLEQGGKSSRVVNCVLALKSYSEWKQSGGIGTWKYSANSKPAGFGIAKSFSRKRSESMNSSFSEKSLDSFCSDQSDSIEAGSVSSFGILVRAALSDKKQEEIPLIVESMINKLSEELESRLATHKELIKITAKAMEESATGHSLSQTASCDDKAEGVEVKASSAEEMVGDESSSIESERKELYDYKSDANEEPMQHVLKLHALVERKRRDIQELKHCLCSTKTCMQVLQMTYQEDVFNLGKHLCSLANAASGYQRVLEENRKLYNQVQDLKGNIRVYCRVRPFKPGQSNTLSSVDYMDERTITILTHSKNGKEARKAFTFNKVFGPSVTQAEVFSDMQPLVQSVLDGYNVCIFAYGQTGSGKTHTMTGPKELTEEGLGVNYRALSDLFHISNQRKETISYDISVQMLEIYNEQVRDLLSADGVNKRYPLYQTNKSCLFSHNGINVPDANLVPVSLTSDVINLMNIGHKNRSVCSTALNDRSSRSHSCLTVHVQGRDLTSGNILRGSMHLVDLAGSERVDKSEVVGNRLKEAQHINKSLSALGDVISSLASRSSHVPYRNSKLTQLLQDSLGGQAKTLMFVHIAPEYEALGETISTLKFAERVATVELGAAKVNKDSGEVKELKEQIASLKAALARKEGDPENLPGSPERNRSKLGSSPSLLKWKSFSDLSCSTVNTEYESSSTSRRDSLESRETLVNPSHWQPLGSPLSSSFTNEDDRDSEASGDWVDKVMVNKHDNMSTRPGKEVSNGQKLSDKFYQSYIPDPTKIYPEHSLNKMTTNKKGNRDFDDDSDRESVTSDCSESDSVSSSIPKIMSSPNMFASKQKKPQPKTTAKSTEIRSSIPSLIPSPSSMRKSPSGVNPNLQKGKRKTGLSK